MALTPEQKKLYLADPSRCPYCGSLRVILVEGRYFRNVEIWKDVERRRWSHDKIQSNEKI